MRLNLLLLLLLHACAPAADWQGSVTTATPVPAGICTTRTWVESGADSPPRFFTSTSLVLNREARARLMAQADAEPAHARTVASFMTLSSGAAVVNGGYYTKAFEPAGLLLINGRTMAPRTTKALFSGFLAIDRTGKISLRQRDDPLLGIVAARQSGPFLIDPGGRVGIHAEGHAALARRTVVLTSADGRAALVVTTSVTLYDLARCLHDQAPGFGLLKIACALNLDGGPSTAMSVRGLRVADVSTEKAPVRDVVVVLAPPAK